MLLDIPRVLSQRRELLAQPLAALLGLRYRPGLIGRWLAGARSVELRRTVLAWIRASLPAAPAGSRFDVGEERDMLILRFRTPDFDTADELWRYNLAMKGMEDLLALQLRKKFGGIPPDYASPIRRKTSRAARGRPARHYLMVDSSANRSAGFSRWRTTWTLSPSTISSTARPRVL